MYDEFPWIKFTILTVLFGGLILYFTPGLKWKITFALAVPVGVWGALAGYKLHK